MERIKKLPPQPPREVPTVSERFTALQALTSEQMAELVERTLEHQRTRVILNEEDPPTFKP